MTASSTLVIAWGNPGRRDDGLGAAFAAAVDALGLPCLAVESGYQLQIEDAPRLAAFDRVWFIDADRCGDAPFRVRRVEPEAGGIGFTSHGFSPGRLLALARDLFGGAPEAWLMGIRGYDFDEFGEGLSPQAQSNLADAVAFARDAFAADGGERYAAPARPVVYPAAQAVRG